MAKKKSICTADSTGKSAADEKLDIGASSLTAWQLIRTYDDKVWEQFIEEWSEGFDPPYVQVVPLGGAGDKGRDLIAYAADPTKPDAEWDSYQCKHYKNLLTPTDIYVELGKLCYYTHQGDYTVPRKYYFVSPLGVGTKLHDLLKKPDVLRAELIANWEKYCQKDIQAQEVPLNSALREYVNKFDFRIVWFKTPTEILNQHRRTKYWHQRFKIELPTRPALEPPPADVQSHELPYVEQLLAAYSDHTKRELKTLLELSAMPPLLEHFKRSRGYFYSAEALSRFSRDHFTPGAFEIVKRHIHDGVADIPLCTHEDAFRCVLAVTGAAAGLIIPKSDLEPYAGPADKKGVCHHLANDGTLRWVST